MAKNIEISHKNKRIKIIIRALRAVAVLALLGVIIYVAVRLRKHPELASSENIVKLVSPNQIIATMEFILLYNDRSGCQIHGAPSHHKFLLHSEYAVPPVHRSFRTCCGTGNIC